MSLSILSSKRSIVAPAPATDGSPVDSLATSALHASERTHETAELIGSRSVRVVGRDVVEERKEWVTGRVLTC